MSGRGRHSGRSVRTSRDAIVVTFNALVLNGRYAELGVRELARKAGVGRSTFYQHFDDKMALLVESLYPLLSVLAEAAAGDAAPRLCSVLSHFADQRENALALFRAAPERAAIEAGLAKLVVQRLPRNGGPIPIDDVASTLSRVTIGMIGDWLSGVRVGCDELAVAIRKTAIACRGALLS